SRRRHTRSYGDWSSDVCSSDLVALTNMSSAAAQGDLKQPIGRCATQDGDLKRLACYDSIAKSLGYSRTPTAANVTGSGGWQVSRSEERRVGKECGARGGACRVR